jgi:hypothetical protein
MMDAKDHTLKRRGGYICIQTIKILAIFYKISHKSAHFLVYPSYHVWQVYNTIFATLGPSWNFSLAENLASLSLQDGPRSGIIS